MSIVVGLGTRDLSPEETSANMSATHDLPSGLRTRGPCSARGERAHVPFCASTLQIPSLSHTPHSLGLSEAARPLPVGRPAARGARVSSVMPNPAGQLFDFPT